MSLFVFKLTLGQACRLFSLVMCGKEHPVEKNRDQAARELIMISSFPFCLSDDQMQAIGKGDSEG
jgi:hypothetical protein